MTVDFNARARDWDTHDHTDRAHRLAEAIGAVVPLQPDWRLADIGGGTGLLARELGPRVAHVLIVDTSPGMLEVARANTAGDPRYATLEHDLAAAPLPQRVDALVSSMALHHIPDTDAALRHARASLEPGGWIALADLDADHGHTFHDDGFDGHHGIDRHALADALRSLGFSQVTDRTATTVVKEKHGIRHEHSIFLVTGKAG